MMGPCAHCGINETKLWRKGPNEKPVLCNACGLHFKARGNLENYLPKISQQNQLSDQTPGGSNLWNPQIPQMKRSFVKRPPPTERPEPMERLEPVETLTPIEERRAQMERFHNELRNLWESTEQSDDSSSDDILLFDNMNNFIPSNEIGLGCSFLKKDGTSTDEDDSHP